MELHHFSAALIEAAKLVQRRGSRYLTPGSVSLHHSSDSCSSFIQEKVEKQRKYGNMSLSDLRTNYALIAFSKK